MTTGIENTSRLFYTLCINCIAFILGWYSSTLGPSLSSLQQQTHSKFSVIAMLLVTFQASKIPGVALYSLINSQERQKHIIVVCLFLLALFTATVPLVTDVVIQFVTIVPCGAIYGIIRPVLFTVTSHLWGQKADVHITLIFLIHSTGAFLSPLFCVFFLPKDEERILLDSFPYNEPEMFVTIKGNMSKDVQKSNFTAFEYGNMSDYGNESNVKSRTMQLGVLTSIINRPLFVPFIVTSGLSVMCLILNLVNLFFSASKSGKQQGIEYTCVENNTNKAAISKRKETITLLTYLFVFLVNCSTRCMLDFQPSFLHHFLFWSQPKAAVANTAFSVFRMIGKMASLVTVSKFKAKTLLDFHNVVCLIGSVFYTVEVFLSLKEHYIWACAAVIGIGESVLFTLQVVLLIRNGIAITPRISSIQTIMGVLGAVFGEMILGFTFQYLSPACFIINDLLLRSLTLVLTAILYNLSRE